MIEPANGNGHGASSAYGTAFSNEIGTGITDSASLASAADAYDNVYETTEPTSAEIYNSTGALIAANTLRAVYSDSGTFLGSYGIDPSTGKFAAWNAAGQEKPQTASSEITEAPRGAVAFSATGSPVLYDGSGNITGLDVSGFLIDNFTIGVETTSVITNQVYSDTGALVGEINYDPNGGTTSNGAFLIETASGQAIDATTWLAGHGLQQAADDLQNGLTESVSDSTELENEKASVEAALEGLLLQSNGSQSVDVDNGKGTLLGSFTIANGQATVYSATGTAQPSTAAYLEALGITSAEVGEVSAELTQVQGSSPLTASQNSSALQAQSDIDAALEAYIRNGQGSQADSFVSALSSAQVADVFGTLSSADVALISPDALTGVSAYALALAPSLQISGFGTNAAGLSSSQVSSIAGRVSGNLGALSPTATSALTAAQTVDLVSLAQLQQFSASQISTLQQNGALNATQLAIIATPGLVTQSLTKSQVEALLPQQLDYLNTSQWDNLNVSWLSATQVAQTTNFSSVDSQTLQRLQSASLSGSISNLSTLSGTALTDAGPTVLSSFTPAALGTLQPSQVTNFYWATTDGLNGTQIAALSPSVIQALSPSAFSGLSSNALPQLTQAQLKVVSSAQLNQLYYTQWDAINVSELLSTAIAGVTSYAQLNSQSFLAIAAGGKLSALSDLSTLTNDTLQSIAPDVVSQLSSQQLSSLSASQLGLLLSQENGSTVVSPIFDSTTGSSTAAASINDSYQTALGSLPTNVNFYDAHGKLASGASLQAVFNPISGAYLGSYGIDPDTGDFTAWDANGTAYVPAGPVVNGEAFSANGASPVVFDSGGNVVGFNIAGYIQGSLTYGEDPTTPQQTSSLEIAILDSSGNYVESIDMAPDGSWNVATEGELVSSAGAAIETNVGGMAVERAASAFVQGTGPDNASNQRAAWSVESALAQYALAQAGYSNDTVSDSAVISAKPVFDTSNVYQGVWGLDSTDSNIMSVYSAAGVYSGSVDVDSMITGNYSTPQLPHDPNLGYDIDAYYNLMTEQLAEEANMQDLANICDAYYYNDALLSQQQLQQQMAAQNLSNFVGYVSSPNYQSSPLVINGTIGLTQLDGNGQLTGIALQNISGDNYKVDTDLSDGTDDGGDDGMGEAPTQGSGDDSSPGNGASILVDGSRSSGVLAQIYSGLSTNSGFSNVLNQLNAGSAPVSIIDYSANAPLSDGVKSALLDAGVTSPNQVANNPMYTFQAADGTIYILVNEDSPGNSDPSAYEANLTHELEHAAQITTFGEPAFEQMHSSYITIPGLGTINVAEVAGYGQTVNQLNFENANLNSPAMTSAYALPGADQFVDVGGGYNSNGDTQIAVFAAWWQNPANQATTYTAMALAAFEAADK